MESENKRLKVLIVILLVFLIAFGAYYFCEKVLLVDDKENPNEVINDIITSDDAESIVSKDWIEISLSEAEKQQINVELNKVFGANASMGFLNGSGLLKNIEYNKNYLEDDCNKLKFAYYYLIHVDSRGLFEKYYDEEIKENWSRIKFSSLVDTAKEFFNTEEINQSSCDESYNKNANDYIMVPLGGGGWEPYFFEITKKYKYNDRYILLLNLEKEENVGKVSIYQKVKIEFGRKTNGDKYLIGFEYYK